MESLNQTITENKKGRPKVVPSYVNAIVAKPVRFRSAPAMRQLIRQFKENRKLKS